MKIFSFFQRCLRGISGHKMMSTASVCIVAASLILLGMFVALSININEFMSLWGDSREINVYISKDASGRSIEDIGAELRAINGVEKVTYRSKEDRLKNVAEQIYGSDSEDLTAGENLLRNSYIIVAADSAAVPDIARFAQEVDGVEEIVRNSDIINGIDLITGTVRSIGVWIMLILLLMSIFIIFNTIKLCVQSQGDEIRLMKTIGATDNFIRIPYIMQGAFLGISGAVIASAVIICTYAALAAQIALTVSADIVSVVPTVGIAVAVIPIFVVTGVIIGVAGGIVSVGKYLK